MKNTSVQLHILPLGIPGTVQLTNDLALVKRLETPSRGMVSYSNSSILEVPIAELSDEQIGGLVDEFRARLFAYVSTARAGK